MQGEGTKRAEMRWRIWERGEVGEKQLPETLLKISIHSPLTHLPLKIHPAQQSVSPVFLFIDLASPLKIFSFFFSNLYFLKP